MTSNAKLPDPVIVVIDDEESIIKLLSVRLEREGYKVIAYPSGAAAVADGDLCKREDLYGVITDLKMPTMDGFQTMEELRRLGLECPIMMITGHGDKEAAIEALHKGAFDYLEKPFDLNELVYSLKRAVDREQLRRTNVRLVEQLREKLEVTTTLLDRQEKVGTSFELVGESENIKSLKQTVHAIAESFRGHHDPVVLVTGESGVGKEVVARYVHEQVFSLRHARTDSAVPFVAVNCAAFPEHLLESELFGYEKGAFTGAQTRKLGLFELANGGTLFLDEIGEMDLRMQVKLLRVLQERVIRRLGGHQDIAVSPNIVAATNKDLSAAVQSKTFREDLYYRLNTLPLSLAPLRSRQEDIVPLAEHFLKGLAEGRAKKIKGFSAGAIKAMQQYRWPGNVRELKSIIERAVILEKGPSLELHQLRQENMRVVMGATEADMSPVQGSPPGGNEIATVTPLFGSTPSIEQREGEQTGLTDLRKAADEAFVKGVLVQHLAREKGNVSAVARTLKMDRANLLRLFRRFSIDPEVFREKAA